VIRKILDGHPNAVILDGYCDAILGHSYVDTEGIGVE
jgi:hypothetical protein